MNIIKKIDNGLEAIENWIVVITGVAVCAIIFINAIARYILKTDFYGNEEITLFLAFWLYFTGSSIAAKKNTHITADMIGMFTKNQAAIKTVHFFRDLITLIMAVVASVWACQYVIWSGSMGAKSPVFKLPMLISQVPIMISFILWALYALRDFIKIFTGKGNTAEEVREGE